MKKFFIVLFILIFLSFCLVSCNLFHEHEFGEWKVTQTPTCVEDGSQERTCASCGEIETQVLNATGEHNYNSQITSVATCVKEGEKTYTCVNCSNTYKETVPATGTHKYTSKVSKNATCVAEGLKVFACSDCNHSYTEAIPATGIHQYASAITKKADCITDGVKTFTCSRCADAYTEVIPATGNHQYAGKITQNPTCSSDGIKTYTCHMCNDSYTEIIFATGNHQYSEKITKKATCDVDGVKTFTCQTCKDIYTQIIESTGHSWESATCTAPKTCVKCNKTSGNALGHTTDNGICGRCGITNIKSNENSSTSLHRDYAEYPGVPSLGAMFNVDTIFAPSTVGNSTSYAYYSRDIYASGGNNALNQYIAALKSAGFTLSLIGSYDNHQLYVNNALGLRVTLGVGYISSGEYIIVDVWPIK